MSDSDKKVIETLLYSFQKLNENFGAYKTWSE